MTWKELKEHIEQMSPENQEKPVMVWDTYSFPKPANGLFDHGENVYSDGNDPYSETYFKGYPERLTLVLQKHQYYLSV